MTQSSRFLVVRLQLPSKVSQGQARRCILRQLGATPRQVLQTVLSDSLKADSRDRLHDSSPSGPDPV